jgi:hypothetical protein
MEFEQELKRRELAIFNREAELNNIDHTIACLNEIIAKKNKRISDLKQRL